MAHDLSPELIRRPVRVLVVGCGGNGSAITAGLPYLHQAMLVHGHCGGLEVTLMDGDAISATNCVRQPFSQAEIGHSKAVVLVSRLNLFWGLQVARCPGAFLGTNECGSGGHPDCFRVPLLPLFPYTKAMSSFENVNSGSGFDKSGMMASGCSRGSRTTFAILVFLQRS